MKNKLKMTEIKNAEDIKLKINNEFIAVLSLEKLTISSDKSMFNHVCFDVVTDGAGERFLVSLSDSGDCDNYATLRFRTEYQIHNVIFRYSEVAVRRLGSDKFVISFDAPIVSKVFYRADL